MMILMGLLVFTIIILVHELGHFWAARRAGILVEEFSIGMGPRLLHFKRGDTVYSLKLFPIGGSCLMLGEDESGVTDPRSFGSRPVGWRILVISAGAILNFVLAFVLSTIMAMFTASPDTTIRDFAEISPIYEAGVRHGDRIVRINNRNITLFGDVGLEMHLADGSPMDVMVEREGQRLNFAVTPVYIDGAYRLGFIPNTTVGPFFARTQADAEGNMVYVDDLEWIRRAGFFESFGAGYDNMIFSIRSVFFTLRGLITGTFGIDGMMGVVGIVAFVGDEAESRVETGGGMAVVWFLISFTALLSANLGVLNLLPLPALDGGRLVFLILEAIRRKPINPDREGMVHFVGLVLLMGLLVFVTYNDIVRLFSS
ncbi:MAG: site-2 protease family protein [Defluviitaleaceae bacterium]|nr:site-2 protease family protein [Defluviitaleaceae bacterium]